MALITVLRLISFLLFIIFFILGLYETIKVYKHFYKETKKRKVLKEEYYQKTKKLYFIEGKNKIHAIKKDGEILFSWDTFTDFLKDELKFSESIMKEEIPDDWWS
ncbi:hypothetical protein [Neobacillus vireti]|uniref:hypothetical protein n=1 Tax=Neobacillus vireti TaxID=220686 RepID=UPI002FFDD2D2